ncbi:MAG: hypothetical protein WA949_15020 [Phormidesmis sp.]
MTRPNYVLTDRLFTAIATASVLAAAVTGFWLLGSPGQQRLISLDEERVQALSTIAGDIYGEMMTAEGEPPKTLPSELPEYIAGSKNFRDPATNEPYRYQRLSDTTYQLCATFDTRFDEQHRENVRRFGLSDWTHPEGRHCFEIDRGRYVPNQK